MLRVRGGGERAQKFSRRKAKHLEVLAFNYSTFFIAMVTQELLSSRRFFYSLPGAGNKKKRRRPPSAHKMKMSWPRFYCPLARSLSLSLIHSLAALTDLFAEWRSRSESVFEQVPDNACLLLQPPISKTTTGSAAAANTCRQSGQCAAEHAFFIVPQPTQSPSLQPRALGECGLSE
jgi:hypothetical protein